MQVKFVPVKGYVQSRQEGPMGRMYEILEEARRSIAPSTGPLAEAANLVNKTLYDLSTLPLRLVEADRLRLEGAMNQLLDLGKSLWVELGVSKEIFRK